MTRLLLLATVLGAAAQQVAAAEDLHAEMHYSDHYDNNLKPLHHYFYEWPSHSTYSPTESSMPSAMPTPSPQQAEEESASTSRDEEPPTPSDDSTRTTSSQGSDADGEWNVLTHEHFIGGFGVFQEVEARDVHHYPSTLGREGVVQLRKSATLPSYDIAVDSSQLKVEFSFYANSMNVGEGFCLEYSLNDDEEWLPVRCWQSSIDFENSQWNDDFNAELHLVNDRVQVDSLRIKFESIASRDDVDVMFDRISLLQR